jgi:hypothetical protein
VASTPWPAHRRLAADVITRLGTLTSTPQALRDDEVHPERWTRGQAACAV